MRNVRILVAYDGSRFHGWQRQEGFDSVQEALELAVLSLTSNSVRVHGAGRTDAGVHALGQVAHFHVATALDDSRLRNALNAHLPEGVVVRRLETCADDFHAQFHAQGKRYGYRVETQGHVVAISGDTVDCAGLRRLAQGADVLVQCCYLAEAEITSEHFKRLAQYTLACGDTVGRIAAECGVKTLVLTHQRPRRDDAMLQALAAEVARDFKGRLVLASDLDQVVLGG